MNLTHVLAFHRVAAAGSYTLAARMSGVSQPTLSAQVRSLEKMVGRPLFVRARRRIRLTPAGEQLYAATTRLSDAVEAVAAVLGAARDPVGGQLRVAADSAVHVIPVLADMRRQSQSFTFRIRIDNSGGVIQQVLNDEADVGVMARPIEDARLYTVRLRSDRIVLLVPRKHAWTGRKSVRLEALAKMDLVTREKGSVTREVIDTRLASAGFRPRQTIEVETREAVREAVAAGLGIGIVFASEAKDDRRLASVPIVDADATVNEFIVCRAERRNLGLVGRFIQTAQRIAGENGWARD